MSTDLTSAYRELIRRRRMVRSFTDQPVDPAVVRRILDAARRAPTAGNSQGVEFVVVTDPAARAAIAAPSDALLARSGHHNFVAQAPVHVVVCTRAETYKARYREPDKQQAVRGLAEDRLWRVPFWYSDAGAAKMLILLGAVAEGIAAAFVGVLPHRHDAVHELLGIPDDVSIVGVALLGHEAPDAREFGDVSARPRPRRSYDEVVHHERW